ncbi:MAG: exo-alpha-sialidase [Armatimonadetes bacterium]|nr:exo-alpha-sialidase [Armatimonadota bacterium]
MSAERSALRRDRLIFPMQTKHVHSSSIVECPNGDLLCAWFHGSGERRATDVVIQGARLRVGSDEWSAVFPMADTPGLPDCNPVLFVDPSTPLWLFWIAVPAESWEDSILRCRKATQYADDGAPVWTWQDDILLDPGDRFADAMAAGLHRIREELPAIGQPRGRELRETIARIQYEAWDLSKRQRGWMTRCHVLVLPSGRMLLPLYSDGFLACLMAISDDQGRTWRCSSPIVGMCLNQPSVVRRRGGLLVAYMREEDEVKRRVLVSESRDDGETWSPARWTDIPNPNSSVEVIALRDGRWVMAFNDTGEHRDSLALAMSDDEGKTWRWKRHLERKTGGSFDYPSVIQTRDGRVHVTYSYQPGAPPGRSIRHTVVDPEWIASAERPAETGVAGAMNPP